MRDIDRILEKSPNGFVDVAGWRNKYLPLLGPQWAFIAAHPHKYKIIWYEWPRYRVSRTGRDYEPEPEAPVAGATPKARPPTTGSGTASAKAPPWRKPEKPEPYQPRPTRASRE